MGRGRTDNDGGKPAITARVPARRVPVFTFTVAASGPVRFQAIAIRSGLVQSACMRVFVFMTMLAAWLGYGLMPGIATRAVPTAAMMHGTMMATTDAAPHHHSQAGAAKNGSVTTPHCPNCSGMTHAASCPGCLTVLPESAAGQGRLHPFRYPAPCSDRFRLAFDAAPMTPPPRS